MKRLFPTLTGNSELDGILSLVVFFSLCIFIGLPG